MSDNDSYFAMSEFMIVEIGWGSEAFVTDVTDMRFFTWMNATMSIQGGGCGEAFPTNITFMWFFT